MRSAAKRPRPIAAVEQAYRRCDAVPGLQGATGEAGHFCRRALLSVSAPHVSRSRGVLPVANSASSVVATPRPSTAPHSERRTADGQATVG